MPAVSVVLAVPAGGPVWPAALTGLLRPGALADLDAELVVVRCGPVGLPALAAPGVRVLTLPDAGEGTSWARGLDEARGRVLVALAPDQPDPVGAVRALTASLRGRRLDLVAGCRTSGTTRLDRVVAAAARTLLGTSLSDPRCRSLALHRDVWPACDVRSTTGTFTTELKHEALRQGYACGEVTVAGAPTPGPTGGLLEALTQLLAHRRRAVVPVGSRTAASHVRGPDDDAAESCG